MKGFDEMAEHAGSMATDLTRQSPVLPPSVLWKAFAVLGSFSQSRRVLSLAEIAKRSKLPKSTAHRVLAMLLEVDAVEQHADGYRMGVRMLTMATCAPEVGLRDVALPYLEELHRVTGQTLHLATLRGPEVIYLEKLRMRRSAVTPTVVGGRLPAHCTAVGKAMLAFGDDDIDPAATGMLTGMTPASVTSGQVLSSELARIRRDGVAFDRQEAVLGLACVAAPIMLHDRPVAALSVAYPASAQIPAGLVNAVRQTAASVERSLLASPNWETLWTSA
jgi:DNA-binding IclR family transcriptional regulator